MRKISENMSQEERTELFGSLIDVVEDWLAEKGFTPNNFPKGLKFLDYDENPSENLDKAIIFGEDYDILADGFASVVGVSRYDEEDFDLKSWAEREVEIACKKDGEWNYGCASYENYESALKAYNSLLEDEHSSFSIGITKDILNRLIDIKPLTPIEDTDDVWIDISNVYLNKEKTSYQCKRMTSLFKYVYPDGTVKYRDVNRALCVIPGVDGKKHSCLSGLVNDIVDEFFPITMPYMPENEPYKVCCERFLYDTDSDEDFDTEAVLYLIKPDGSKIDIYRHFAWTGDGYLQIGEEEYFARKEKWENDINQ